MSLLLRKPILQEEDMLYTVAAAEAGLIYTEEVSSEVECSEVIALLSMLTVLLLYCTTLTVLLL